MNCKVRLTIVLALICCKTVTGKQQKDTIFAVSEYLEPRGFEIGNDCKSYNFSVAISEKKIMRGLFVIVSEPIQRIYINVSSDNLNDVAFNILFRNLSQRVDLTLLDAITFNGLPSELQFKISQIKGIYKKKWNKRTLCAVKNTIASSNIYQIVNSLLKSYGMKIDGISVVNAYSINKNDSLVDFPTGSNNLIDSHYIIEADIVFRIKESWDSQNRRESWGL